MNLRQATPFTSHLERGEMRAVMVYLIIHVGILPYVINLITAKSGLSAAEGNFIYYALGTAFMFSMCMGFLRRDFDPICDRPIFAMLEVLSGYFSMLCVNFCVAYIIVLVMPPETTNPNNEELTGLVVQDFGTMKASLMFFTPIVEEMLFRAGIFGMLRDLKGRKFAYIASALLFALYHVWSYAVMEPIYLVYLLQYIPAGLLLARCYERTNSIWCAIFFHMTVNGVAVNALEIMQGMV